MSTTAAIDQDERAIEEAHCSECGVPITAIPSWYANVAVKFTCDQCRQKSSKLPTGIPVLDVETPRASAVDPDSDAEPAIDEIDIEDEEIDDSEIETAE